MDNTGTIICGVLCGLPAFVTGLVILYFRALAKRHLALDIERSSRPAPDQPPEFKRVTLRLDLQERKPRPPRKSKEESEE